MTELTEFQVNHILRLEQEVSNLEFISDSLIIGLSSDQIFYIDRRDANKINYVETERLGNSYALSCNHTNTNEFVVGTGDTAQIFDIRQMRPIREIYEGYSSISGNNVHVSWSPNGKYIFTSHCGYKTNLVFFWDVLNAEKITISKEIVDVVDWFEEGIWIDNHLVVSTWDDVCALAPRASAMEAIYQSENFSMTGSYGQNYYPSVYNEKTLQLAGLLDEGICIWSHYKLPPYAMQQS